MTPYRISPFFFVCALSALSACSSSLQLKAIKAVTTQVETTISTTSTGTVDAQNQAVLNFGTAGRVESILVRAGQAVKKGQLIAKLDNRDAQTSFDNASKELGRAKELFKDGLVSQAGLDDGNKGYEFAKANLDRSEIRAPFDGVISEVNLKVGELSQTGLSSLPPIRIVDQKPRIVKGDIDEIDLWKVKKGMPARIKIPAMHNQGFAAEVSQIIPYINTSKEQERTAKIELKIVDNDTTIPVGASAEIEIITESKPNVLALPTRSVLGMSKARYVYIYDDGKIRKTSVTVGIGNYDRTELLSGVSLGDTVILPGDLELKDGGSAKIEIQPWP